jgi:pyrroloquinoline quinone biosynthesis protein B
VCLTIVDPESRQRWLVECTPDFKYQLHALDTIAPMPDGPALSGIFVTHAHIGHYAGLVHLGREVMGSQNVPVFVMPRMANFLKSSGPWNQLVELQQIDLRPLADGTPVPLNSRLSVTPILVPHRDEFSETVAFRITGPRRSVLFLPDIDKWERWERQVEDELALVSVAYLDATFFDASELPGRNHDEIPHPFVVESIARFSKLPPAQRAKVRFLHLNHSNPLLDPRSAASQQVQQAGMAVARQLEQVEL